ncbi:MAG: LLM class flavin-dependent oxidoreductase [Chloroflexi bacterium]|nr:LLM class flavin-dependent oxidoreductase [Chloroflexota bacterium]
MIPLTYTILHHTAGDAPEKSTAQVYAEVLEHVILADQVGFDSIWFAEHHGRLESGRLPWPLLFIMQAAAHTRRVTLGTAVTLLPYYHPLAVAEQVAEADILTGGRFALGIGTGSLPADFAAFGVDPATKRERTREGIEVLLRAWPGTPFTFQGQFYQVGQTCLAPCPTRPAREMLWLAAMHLDSARLAGELDMHLMLSRGTPPETARQIIAAYHAALEQAGHPKEDRSIQRTWMAYAAESEGRARDEVLPAAHYYYRLFREQGRPPLQDPDDLDALLEYIDIVVGTPDYVVAELAQRAAAVGLTHATLHTRLPDISHERLLRSTELLGRGIGRRKHPTG